MNQHIRFVESWAEKIKENKIDWKTIHTEFINSQFQKSEEFIKRLSKEKDGIDKIIKLYNIKNIKGYHDLLKKND